MTNNFTVNSDAREYCESRHVPRSGGGNGQRYASFHPEPPRKYQESSGAHQERTASFRIPGGGENFPFRNYPRRNCPLANVLPPLYASSLAFLLHFIQVLCLVSLSSGTNVTSSWQLPWAFDDGLPSALFGQWLRPSPSAASCVSFFAAPRPSIAQTSPVHPPLLHCRRACDAGRGLP